MRGMAGPVLVVVFVALALALPAAASAAQQPTTQWYTVRQGDTLWSIARRHGTRPEHLAAANGIRLEGTLAIGQVLRVPAAPESPLAGAPGPAKARRTSAPAFLTHRVRAGDTLWGIARRYGTRPERIAALNAMPPEAILKIGRTLKVPAPSAAARTGETVDSEGPAGARSPAARALRGRLAALPSRGHAWTSALLSLSRRYLGVRYRWGGTSPSGFDCSGFLYYVYGRMGVALPRTTFDMYDAGVPVPREELRAGDLVFFQTVSPGPSHAGIYLGDGRFIHSSSGAGGVLITSMDHDYYAPRYLGARRF